MGLEKEKQKIVRVSTVKNTSSGEFKLLKYESGIKHRFGKTSIIYSRASEHEDENTGLFKEINKITTSKIELADDMSVEATKSVVVLLSVTKERKLLLTNYYTLPKWPMNLL